MGGPPTSAKQSGRTAEAPRARIFDYDAQLATLVDAPPSGELWFHEQKFDGYRIGAVREGRTVRLHSRRGQEWTAKMTGVAAAVRELAAESLVLDGEVAVLMPNGVTSFQALQRSFESSSPVRPTYFVFDLLYLDGHDLRGLPLEERKRLLAALLKRGHAGGVIRFSDHVVGHGSDFFAQACSAGLEGIVSKRRDARYRAGRNLDWQKTKCSKRQELVIGGFTEPEGSRSGIGSLLVGYYEGEALHWAGNVGTGDGWNHTYLSTLRKKLDALETKTSPFEPPVSDASLRRRAHWVRPALVGEVAFAEWTDDGRVRHGSMKGIREDKAPKSVVREAPVVTAAAASASVAAIAPSIVAASTKSSEETARVAGIAISHADRLVYPTINKTKLDIARYYEAVARWMLPHVEGRPLTLLRCERAVDPSAPKGGCSMMRHGRAWGPKALRRVSIKETRKTGEYLVADTTEAIVALAQMDVVEIHTWNGRAEGPYQHDRVVIDLDPGPGVAWRESVGAAKLVRSLLTSLKVQSWVKTTGGNGLHVVVPITAAPWSTCLGFARAIAAALVRHDPRRFTTTLAKAGRERQILIDVLRNNRTNTSVAAYSLRAEAEATVSVPIGWDELDAKLRPAAFTMTTVLAKLKRDGDAWAKYWRVRQTLPDLDALERA